MIKYTFLHTLWQNHTHIDILNHSKNEKCNGEHFYVLSDKSTHVDILNLLKTENHKVEETFSYTLCQKHTHLDILNNPEFKNTFVNIFEYSLTKAHTNRHSE